MTAPDEDAHKPRCQVCTRKLPAPKGRGRPRKYCSDSCRQEAYERRHEIPAFKDRWEGDDGPGRNDQHRPKPHSFQDCVDEVTGSILGLEDAVDMVTHVIRSGAVFSTGPERMLAFAVSELVNAVIDQSIGVMKPDGSIGGLTPEDQAKIRNWPRSIAGTTS
ncbi:MAG: hypothetical protein ACREXY_00815 [Gammaproteobacteria bacterium]